MKKSQIDKDIEKHCKEIASKHGKRRADIFLNWTYIGSELLSYLNWPHNSNLCEDIEDFGKKLVSEGKLPERDKSEVEGH